MLSERRTLLAGFFGQSKLGTFLKIPTVKESHESRPATATFYTAARELTLESLPKYRQASAYASDNAWFLFGQTSDASISNFFAAG